MDGKILYLTTLIDRVFKLLPMKEDYDSGIDNHLPEYLESLYDSMSGSFGSFPCFNENTNLIDVRNNISFLTKSINLSHNRWRSIILRSTRLINAAAAEYEREANHGS